MFTDFDLTFYNVYAICGFAAIGGGLFGFDISSMSGVLGTPAYSNYFGHPAGTRQGGIVRVDSILSLTTS